MSNRLKRPRRRKFMSITTFGDSNGEGVTERAALETRERSVVFLYLLLASLTLAHSVYYTYSSYYVEVHTRHPGAQLTTYYQQHSSTAVDQGHPLFNGIDHAPNQYRVAIPYLARAIGSVTRTTKYYILYACFDFLCALGASWIWYRLLRGAAFMQRLEQTRRLVAVALLLAVMTYPFVWVTYYERPETLPTAVYLALMSLVITQKRRLPRLALTSLLTIWQGFVRSDIPAMFGIVVVLFCWTLACRQLFGSKMRAALFGILTASLAITVQLVLQRVLFPHATYPPDTQFVQLLRNLHPRSLATFGIAILPYGLIVAGAAGCWRRLDPLDQLLVLASLTYMPLWLTIGVDSEVRIFVPYLLALTPTAAKVLLLRLEGAAVPDDVAAAA